MSGFPFAGIAPPPRPNSGVVCGGCMNKAGELAARTEHVNVLKARIAEQA